jgi:hypothetical protein
MKNIFKLNLFILLSFSVAYIATENDFRADVLFYNLYFIFYVETTIKYRKAMFNFLFQNLFYIAVFVLVYTCSLYSIAIIVMIINYWLDNKCFKAIKRMFALKRTFRVEKNEKYQEERRKIKKRTALIERKHKEKGIDLFSINLSDKF